MKTIETTKAVEARLAHKPPNAWATRSEMWRSRVEKASVRRTKRAKPQSALILAGHGVSFRIQGGALPVITGC
jgi:hypothetical protein